MTDRCCLVGCRNTASKSSEVTFHRFPLNDEQLLATWLTAINQKEWKPLPSSNLCSDHFTKADFHPDSSCLKDNSIPSTFPNIRDEKEYRRFEILEKKKYECGICLERYSSKKVLRKHLDQQKHRICDTVPSYLMKFLPPGYQVSHLRSKEINDEAFQAKLVLPKVSDVSLMRTWVEHFSKTNSCTYSKRIVSRQQKNDKIIIREIYFCYHYGPEKGTGRKKKLKGTNCLSKIMTVLKFGTPNFAVITVNFHHNHSLVHDRISNLFVDKKRIFLNMFENGLSALEALKSYQVYIQTQLDNGISKISNKNSLKDYDWIRHLFQKAYENEYKAKKTVGLSARAKKFIANTNAQFDVPVCYISEISNDFFIVIITPLMKKVWESQIAEALIFVDDVGSTNIFGLKVFLLMTEISSTSVPLGILITSNEADDKIIEGFNLIHNLLPENSFKNSTGPAIIVTDDYKPIINALVSIYPTSKFFFCPVRFLRSCYKWLLKNENHISFQKCSLIYEKLQTMVYTEDEATINTCFVYLKSCNLPRKITKYIETLYFKKEQWAISYRKSYLLRETNVNMILEHNYRISKEKVMKHIKATNLEHLLRYLIYDFSDDFRDVCKDRCFNRFCIKEDFRPQLEKYDIHEGPNGTYKVHNKNKELFYNINTNIGTCTCFLGSTGGYCKHQKLVMFSANALFYPLIESESLQTLFYFIATGYRNFSLEVPKLEKSVEELMEVVEVYDANEGIETGLVKLDETDEIIQMELQNELKKFENHIIEIHHEMQSHPRYFLQALEHLNQKLDIIKKDPETILKAMYSVSSRSKDC